MFYSNEEQEIVEKISKFCKSKIIPFQKEWDENQSMPRKIYKELGSECLLGILVPKIYGGQEKCYSDYITIVKELAIFDPSISLAVASQNSLPIGHILLYGNEKQKQKWLPKLSSGEIIGAWALTEPNAGSDVSSIITKAEKKGNDWIINGKKEFITNAKSSDIVIVIAKSKEGLTSFIIDKNTEGIRVGRQENKLGMRALDTAELIFENCIVPQENVLGNPGTGFIQAMKVLEGGRISIAALGLGIAKGALEAASNYAKSRIQFGKPITEFQGISFKIAELATKIKAAELITYEAAKKKNNGEKINSIAAMAKLLTSELAVEASNEAVQIFGKYGYSKDYPAEKYYRDSKLCTIGEGTSEILKIIIAKDYIKNTNS